MRGATPLLTVLWLFRPFQSTHPMRGATKHQAADQFYTSISIHAPHAGCDDRSGGSLAKISNFNPRTPCGVRHFDLTLLIRFHFTISIHAPHAGCDSGTCAINGSISAFQSTHPMRGATRTPSRRSSSVCDFNPRTPCGVRLLIGNDSARFTVPFQSTHPMRGATGS